MISNQIKNLKHVKKQFSNYIKKVNEKIKSIRVSYLKNIK